MRLTEEQIATARTLGLTNTEMVVALKTHIPPETYAKHKREMQAGRDAWDAKMGELAEYAAERLPPREESAGYLGRLPGDGGGD